MPDEEKTKPQHQAEPNYSQKNKPLLEDKVPELPEEFTDLQLVKVLHPSLFFDQAQLLKARYDAFIKAGFSEDQAMQLVLRWGLKKNLTDS